MADTFARAGKAVVGSAITGTTDMPDYSGAHFTWEGQCWEAVTDPDLLVATMDPAASSAAKEALTARIVQAMSVATKKLVVTEEAILNHATLIGQTVVDDINVQGKLVGTDGVFTGTVDFENVNVTDELLASRISGEHIYGTVIEGGEIRTGTDESRGSFRLGDRAYVSPVDGYTAPGLQLEAPDQEYVYPPGLGIDSRAVSVSGGRTADGRYGRLQVNSGGVSAVVSPAPGDTAHWGSRFSVDNTRARLSAGQPAALDGAEVLVSGPVILNGQEVSNAVVRLKVDHNGKSSRVEAGGGVTTVEASDGTTKRSLKVDGSGVWVTTNKSGVTESWNLEETASDTGWRTFPMNSALTGAGSPAYRIKGGVVFFRGTLTLPGANWSSGWTTLGAITNTKARPSTNILRAGASSATPAMLLQVLPSGSFEMWLPSSLPGATTVQLSPMFYPIG